MINIERFNNSDYSTYEFDLNMLEDLIDKINNPVLVTSGENKSIICENDGAYGVMLPNGKSYAIGYNGKNYFFFDEDYRYDFVSSEDKYAAIKRDLNSFNDKVGEIINPFEIGQSVLKYRDYDVDKKNGFEYSYDVRFYNGPIENYATYLRYINEKYPSLIRVISAKKKTIDYHFDNYTYRKILFSLFGCGIVDSKGKLFTELKDEISKSGFVPLIDNEIISMLTQCNNTKILLDANVGLYKSYFNK